MAELQTISMVDILTACPRYIKNGKLGAQCSNSGCMYEAEDGSRCIVGTAMTKETLNRIRDNYHNTTDIGTIDSLDVDLQRGDYNDIITLQRAHDDWARSKYDEILCKKTRKIFYKLLQYMRKKYGVSAK